MNAVLAGLVAVLLAVASVAVWQWRTAVGVQQIALSRQLAAQSAAQMTVNPELAALLAVHAYRTNPTSEATAILYAAAAQPVVRHLTGHTGRVHEVAYSPDGRHLASIGDGATVRRCDGARVRGHRPDTRRRDSPHLRRRPPRSHARTTQDVPAVNRLRRTRMPRYDRLTPGPHRGGSRDDFVRADSAGSHPDQGLCFTRTR